MQRARVFTAWEGIAASARARRWERAWAPLLLAVACAAATAFLWTHPRDPVYDQARLLEARFEAPYHPAPPFGFTSQLLVIALKTALPAAAPLHEILRSVAMWLWVGSAVWLASALLERRALVALLGALLLTSQYPFLWLSSELVTGACLAGAIGARVRGHSPWVVGALLALLGLCKIEGMLVAGALALWWTRDAPSRAEAAQLLGAFAGFTALLVLPGSVRFGPGYLLDYGGTGRGFATFSQHWAALVAPLQLVPGPHPWQQPAPYVERTFPGATSVADVLRADGLPYLDFVALSLARGVRKVGWVFQWGWLAAAALAWGLWRARLAPGRRETTLAVTAVGCVPFVLLAYPHIRYFARYYPIFWLLLFVAGERLAREAEPATARPALVAAAGFTLLALAVNAERAARGLAVAPALGQYWFPD